MPEPDFKPASVLPEAPRHGAGSRIWEIDFLRGLAIILMVLYHAAFDLRELAGVRTLLGLEIPSLDSPLLLAARDFFAGLFIVICGLSSSLTRSNLRRAWKLLGLAAVVTAATLVFDPASAVHFGILHCLGICVLLFSLTLEKSRPLTCAAAGAAVLVFSAALLILLRNASVRFDWLLPFGIHSPSYASFDYFPLFPWLGVYLAGTALGKSVYAPRRSLIPKRLPVSFINIAGRHSLWIYIVHQPVLIGIFYVTGLLR
ncbi:MAG: hypothetical protein A2Y86_04780 [Candidatus Aminicenantes bacterium RBG_13_62_12]|nr:MAG: hypothetical protein A2Y86_04780 [Candidatus Aminicenantes bacterium RBG_13_62_12]